MLNLKGFMVIGPMADNAPNVVADFGEISAKALTYATDRLLYTSPEAKGVGLVVFQSIEEGDDATVEPPFDIHDNILRIGAWCYTASEQGIITGTREDFLTALMNEWGDKIDNVTFGDLITDGSRWMPEFLTWELTAGSNVPENRLKIWFSDKAFRLQYDAYTIRVVPPIDNLDDFFADPLDVQALVNLRSVSETLERVDTAAAGSPYTTVRADVFDYQDPLDPTFKVPTNWTTIHYGIAGNNIDTIKEEIVKHILENSTHPREDWVKIFPDLFTSTEFIMIPNWLQYATENKTHQAGIFSPILRHKDGLQLATWACKSPGYTQDHIIEYGSTLPVMFKSMALMVVGGPENRNGTFLLTDYVKDYINVPATSIDFSRQSPETREWTQLIATLLVAAETMTEFSDVPQKVNRLIRNGVIYAAASFNKVQYLVVAKGWLEKQTVAPVPQT